MGELVDRFVYIIESPSSADLLDLRTEGNVLNQALDLAGIKRSYTIAADADALRYALGARLLDHTKYYSAVPIIHLSMHGSSEGVSLTNQTQFSWGDLRDLLAPINHGLSGALLVCMASCFGAHGCRMAMDDRQSPPFYALVGHHGTASLNDIAVAFITFYHQIFKGIQIHDAVEAMKHASADKGFAYFIGTHVQQEWIKRLQFDQLLKSLSQHIPPGPPPPNSPFRPLYTTTK